MTPTEGSKRKTLTIKDIKLQYPEEQKSIRHIILMS